MKDKYFPQEKIIPVKQSTKSYICIYPGGRGNIPAFYYGSASIIPMKLKINKELEKSIWKWKITENL